MRATLYPFSQVVFCRHSEIENRENIKWRPKRVGIEPCGYGMSALPYYLYNNVPRNPGGFLYLFVHTFTKYNCIKKKCFICMYDPLQWTTLTRNNCIFRGRKYFCDSWCGSTFNGSVMATYGGSFESVNSIEDRKEYKRKAREEVIQKVNMCAL